MIGNRGLGMEVLLSINRVDIGKGFEAGLAIVFLAIVIDRITNAFARTRPQSPLASKEQSTEPVEEAESKPAVAG